MPKVKIIQPFQRDTNAKAFPKTFIAQGFAKGNRVGTVRATLTDVTNSGSINVTSVHLAHFAPFPFRGQPARARFRWQFLCVNVTAQTTVRDFRLMVEAIRAADGVAIANDTANFKVDPNLTSQSGPPTYTFPEPEYEINGPELDLFVPFGLSDISISSVKIGTRDADSTQWLPGTSFWWAEFNHLGVRPGGGDFALRVTNSDGTTETDVTIDAPALPPPRNERPPRP